MAASAATMISRRPRREAGLTLIEVLTLVVALVVIVAVAIPLWRTHQLRVRRADGIEALLAVQKAQDRYFARHARYADAAVAQKAPPEGLGLLSTSPRGHYIVTLERAADELGYVATARARAGAPGEGDARCRELRLDQHGRRSASNADGEDTSADCWSRL